MLNLVVVPLLVFTCGLRQTVGPKDTLERIQQLQEIDLKNPRNESGYKKVPSFIGACDTWQKCPEWSKLDYEEVTNGEYLVPLYNPELSKGEK